MSATFFLPSQFIRPSSMYPNGSLHAVNVPQWLTACSQCTPMAHCMHSMYPNGSLHALNVPHLRNGSSECQIVIMKKPTYIIIVVFAPNFRPLSWTKLKPRPTAFRTIVQVRVRSLTTQPVLSTSRNAFGCHYLRESFVRSNFVQHFFTNRVSVWLVTMVQE